MAIDIEKEKLLDLMSAAEMCEKSVHSLRRDTRTGYRGVVLETVLIGGAIRTSVEAIKRFAVACGEAKNGSDRRKAKSEPAAAGVGRADPPQTDGDVLGSEEIPW